MPSYDVEVDIESLINGSKAATDIVKQKKDHDIKDYVPKENDVANDAVWDAIDEFQDRWERGINDMTDDIEEVAGRLGKVAMNYAEFDNKAKERMQKFVDATGRLETSNLLEGVDVGS